MTGVRRLAAVLLVAAVAACSGSAPKSGESDTNPSASPVVLDVTIIDGHVSPRGARVNLKVGEPLTLAIRSDVDEEIHIHSDPQQDVKVDGGKQKRVTFTAERPGKVAVEVHHLGVVVAEILIRE